MARILAISNQKGGVGKTTTAINLSAALAKSGQRVLLVDLDPQGNASSGLGHYLEDAKQGVYDVLLQDVPLSDVVVATSVEGLDLAPATRDLVGVELEMAGLQHRDRLLRKALHAARERYDWILLDCPPSLSLLTVNALAASDCVLLPLQAQYYAMEGLSELLRTIAVVKRRLNPDLRREGILVTMYDKRNRLCRDVARQARDIFGDEVFTTVIPRNVRLGEAPSHGQSIIQYDPRSTGAKAYVKLAHELLSRNGMAVRKGRRAV